MPSAAIHFFGHSECKWTKFKDFTTAPVKAKVEATELVA
jgi:hypothetical protein